MNKHTYMWIHIYIYMLCKMLLGVGSAPSARRLCKMMGCDQCVAIYIYTYIYIYIYMYIYMYVYMYIYTDMYVHIRVDIYVYVSSHTHFYKYI